MEQSFAVTDVEEPGRFRKATGRVGLTTRDTLGGLGRQAGQFIKPERPEQVLDGAEFFRPAPSSVDPEFLSVLWRGEALLAATALGLGVLEDEIIGYTRMVFHDVPGHRSVSEALLGQDYAQIHRWMDTVPGSGYAGGGILHRLQHGHDLTALKTIYDEHGIPGILVWTQHNAQDLFTPTGIPLPLGSGKLADFLVAHDYATPGKAALLVSFNAVELSAAFLAGAFITRLAAILIEIHRKRRVRRRCKEAANLRDRGDLEGAVAIYSEAYSLSERSPAIALALGWCHTQRSRPTAESFLWFREAARGLAVTETTADLNGVAIDLRGIAYLLALTQAPRVLDDEHMRTYWRDELEVLWRGAIVSFENAAIRQSEPLRLDLGSVDLEWRPRPLSAAANYYLAARAALSVPFLPQGETLRLARKSEQLLKAAIDRYPDHRDRLEDVLVRWAQELRPRGEPLLVASGE